MSATALTSGRMLDGPIPVPPRYSLLVNATVITDLDYHWMAGGQVWPYPDLADGDTHGPCSSGTEREKLEGGTHALPEFSAFSVYVAETCTTRGIGDDEEFANRAVSALNALESALVEREFATGRAVAGNPYLGDPDIDILATSPDPPVEALAHLENAIAATGKMGVIHTDPATAVAWAAARVVEREGAYLRSIATGTPIVSGYGYVGFVPDGQAVLAVDEGWAVATGPVHIRRSEVALLPGSLMEALDMMTNTVTYRAERHYLVDWDTELQAAVLVDRT